MIQYLYLGRVPYAEALRLQEELVALRQQDRIGNVLLLLEHPPVLTLGRNAKRSNVLASDEMLAARGVTLHEINRGGDVTYHGPGQLIGYPIFDLRSLRNANGSRLGPVDFVRLMEEALIRLCGEFGVQAGRICGLTGVWCGVPSPQLSSKGEPSAAPSKSPQPGGRERKIAAIGIHVARGVTSHGFAFNVTTDLRDFALINPCGITDRPVTSLEKELAMEVAGPKSLPSLESIAHLRGPAVRPGLQRAGACPRQPRRSARPGASRSRERAGISGSRHAAPGSSRDRAPAPIERPPHSGLTFAFHRRRACDL